MAIQFFFLNLCLLQKGIFIESYVHVRTGLHCYDFHIIGDPHKRSGFYKMKRLDHTTRLFIFWIMSSARLLEKCEKENKRHELEIEGICDI